MSIFYPPPQPFIGGNQPLAPPIRVLPNPQSGFVPRRAPAVPIEVRQWWDLPPPMPQPAARGVYNPAIFPVTGYVPPRPPVGLPSEIRQWFDLPPPGIQPQPGVFHVVPNPLSGYVPPRAPGIGQDILSWWQIPVPMPQQLSAFVVVSSGGGPTFQVSMTIPANFVFTGFAT